MDKVPKNERPWWEIAIEKSRKEEQKRLKEHARLIHLEEEDLNENRRQRREQEEKNRQLIMKNKRLYEQKMK